MESWNESNTQYIKSYLGSIVEIIEYNGNVVIGIVQKFDANNNFYELIKTTINSSYLGNYNVFEHEIIKWKINTLIKRKKLFKNRSETSEMDSRVLIPKQVNEDEEEDDLYLMSSDFESIDLNQDDDPIVVNLKDLKLKASNDIKFFRDVDNDMMTAVEQIMRCNSVGFSLFGEEISREGSVDVFAFATEAAIYVFRANDQMVPKLKPILESEVVQKVLFICRHTSDALFHLFNIKLNNVIDIRIFDYFLQKQALVTYSTNGYNKNWKKAELRSLAAILMTYLRVKCPKFFPNLDFNHMSVRVQNIIRVKTIFLREISAIINYRLIKEVVICNHRCLESLRSANDIEYNAMKDDDLEIDIIENPINLCEENERKIWESVAIRGPKRVNDSKEAQKQSFETNDMF